MNLTLIQRFDHSIVILDGKGFPLMKNITLEKAEEYVKENGNGVIRHIHPAGGFKK